MAEVIVATAAKVQAVENASIVGATIDESGDLILENGAGDDINVGSVAGTTPDATTTSKGIVELATGAEAAAGTDAGRAVTPQALSTVVAAIVLGTQPADSDLTAIAAIAPANNDVIQRKSGAWTNRTMAQLATDLLATGSFPSGGGSTTYVPFKTVGPTGSGANYIVDGTADNVEVQQAVDALTNGGVVLIAPGITLNFAATVNLAGNDTYNGPTKMIIGGGMHSTKIVCATNVHAFSLTSCANVVIKDLEIQVTGSGSGIVSTMGAGTPALYQAFWNCVFENLYFARNGAGAHTGWAMNLGSPFRSRISNIEVFQLHNGLKFYSQNGAFNPGDFTVDRAFIELDNTTGSIGLHISSPVTNASMNQMTFNMVELIDNAAGGTAILLDGVGSSNHNLFTGINIEQFATLINVDNGTGNRFDLNYIEALAAGTFFKFGTNGSGNEIRSAGMVFVGTKTNTLVNDTNTWTDNPNTINDCYIAVEAGGVLNATRTAATRIWGLRGYNNGTLNNNLQLQRHRVNPPIVTLTDAATIATDVSLSNHFRVTLAGNRTLGVPTNPYDGQKITWEIIQDATGSRTLTLASGTGGFAFGTDITGITLTTTASKRDFLGAIYNATAQRWYVVAFTKGF